MPYSVPLPPCNFFGAARAMPCLIAPLASLAPRGSRLGARLLRRRSQTIRRVCSFLLTLAPRGSRLGARLLRRRSQTIGVSARSSSPRRGAMPCLIAPLAPSRGSRLGARLLRRRSQTIRRVCSFLLTAAGRDAVFDCSARFARSARIAPWSPPTSSSLADDKACLLVPPHRGGARSDAAARPHSRQHLAVA